MEKIDIAEHEVSNLESFAPGIDGLRLFMVNVFGIETFGGWVLVDAGLPMSAKSILKWADERFPERPVPQCILLTHGHFDHAGAAEDLVAAWDVPVYAHAEEMPYLTGQSRYPPPDPGAGGGLMSFLSPLYPRGPVDLGRNVVALPPNGYVPHLPNWQWIHTPGHTKGHISLFRPEDRTLLPGDAFCTTKPESFLAVTAQKAELHGPPAYYTSDWVRAERSVALLAELEPRAVGPGHGKPIAGEHVASELKLLASDFRRIAVPDGQKQS